MTAFLLVFSGFLAGSVPFSWIFSKIGAKRDLRSIGDGNPGAWNAFRAGGARTGVPSLLLDVAKGALPAALAFWVFSLSGFVLAMAMLAPVLGHAFSPWLRFRGGKAIATTFGVWAGVTRWEGPLVMAFALLLLLRFQKNDAWTTVLAALTMTLWMTVFRHTAASGGLWLAAWGNLGLLIWTHRSDLRQPMRWRRGAT